MINRGVLAAGALVVLANGAILANVARNRAGNPDAVVRLSEREAQAYLPPDEQAELMLILRLRWQMALGPAGEDSWFTRERLEALGFPGIPAEGDTAYPGRYHLSRDVRRAEAEGVRGAGGGGSGMGTVGGGATGADGLGGRRVTGRAGA